MIDHVLKPMYIFDLFIFLVRLCKYPHYNRIEAFLFSNENWPYEFGITYDGQIQDIKQDNVLFNYIMSIECMYNLKIAIRKNIFTIYDFFATNHMQEHFDFFIKTVIPMFIKSYLRSVVEKSFIGKKLEKNYMPEGDFFAKFPEFYKTKIGQLIMTITSDHAIDAFNSVLGENKICILGMAINILKMIRNKRTKDDILKICTHYLLYMIDMPEFHGNILYPHEYYHFWDNQSLEKTFKPLLSAYIPRLGSTDGEFPEFYYILSDNCKTSLVSDTIEPIDLSGRWIIDPCNVFFFKNNLQNISFLQRPIKISDKNYFPVAAGPFVRLDGMSIPFVRIRLKSGTSRRDIEVFSEKNNRWNVIDKKTLNHQISFKLVLYSAEKQEQETTE